jgi:FkbM family methyltransferase
MTERQESKSTTAAHFRRFAWRFGRLIYCRARGEPAGGGIVGKEEAYVQSCVVAAARVRGRLTVLDVGANLGDWALPMLTTLPSQLAAKGAVVAHLFEPVPATRKKLLDRTENVRPGVIQIHDWALSDIAGTATMVVVDGTGGRSSLVAIGQITSETVSVQKMTLTETFVRLGIEHAELVKIDAEGHDLAILRGARELLTTACVDVIQFEYNDAWVHSHAFLKDVFDLIEGFPYRLARIRPRSIELLNAWHPELDRFFHANYIIVSESALSWFNVRRGAFDDCNTYA